MKGAAAFLRLLKMRSDGDVETAKDHHCGEGSKATGGRKWQKVTLAAKMRRDGDVETAKNPWRALEIVLLYTIIPIFKYPDIHFLKFFANFLLSYPDSGSIILPIVVFLKKFELVCD